MLYLGCPTVPGIKGLTVNATEMKETFKVEGFEYGETETAVHEAGHAVAEIAHGRHVFFHGTSTKYLEQILAEGIRPNGTPRGSLLVNDPRGKPSNPNYVYLMENTPETTGPMSLLVAIQFAWSAVAGKIVDWRLVSPSPSSKKKYHERAVVLEIEGLDASRFREGMGVGFTGEVAYEGIIRPERIRGGWEFEINKQLITAIANLQRRVPFNLVLDGSQHFTFEADEVKP
jgi:hypothetical protein